jgi:hypothetical protein
MTVSTEKQVISSVQPLHGIIGWVFLVIGLLMFGIVAFLYTLYGTVQLTDFDQVNLNLPFLIPGLAGLIFALVGGLILIFKRLKRQRIINTLRNGALKEGKVISNIQNFHYTVNNIPQRKVTFEAEGQTYVYAFFGEEWAQVFSINAVFNIRTNRKGLAYPDPLFLESLIRGSQQQKSDMNQAFSKGAQQMVQAAEKMLAQGDKAAALSYFDAAHDFKADATTYLKIIELANELNDTAILKKYSSK